MPTSERGGRRVRGEGRTGRGRRKREKSEGRGREVGKRKIYLPTQTHYISSFSIHRMLPFQPWQSLQGNKQEGGNSGYLLS